MLTFSIDPGYCSWTFLTFFNKSSSAWAFIGYLCSLEKFAACPVNPEKFATGLLNPDNFAAFPVNKEKFAACACAG